MTPRATSPEVSVDQVPTRRTVDLDALRGVCRSTLASALADAESEVANAEATVASYDRNLRTALTSRQQKLRVKTSLEAQIADTSTGYEAVARYLEGLMASGKYTDFSFGGSKIKARTSTIFIEVPAPELVSRQRRFELGIYEAEVDLVGLTVKFRLIESRQAALSRGVIHPHIRDGNACWGNVQAEVPRIIQRGDYGVIFELIHDFLTSYNEGSPYAVINLFPRARGHEDPVPPQQVTIAEAAPGDVGVTPPATGFFANIARTLPPQVQAPTPATVTGRSRSRTQEGIAPNGPAAPPPVMHVFSEAVDRDLRAQGVAVARLTSYERERMRRLLVDVYGSGIYQRHLDYYVRWLRNGRTRGR